MSGDTFVCDSCGYEKVFGNRINGESICDMCVVCYICGKRERDIVNFWKEKMTNCYTCQVLICDGCIGQHYEADENKGVCTKCCRYAVGVFVKEYINQK